MQAVNESNNQVDELDVLLEDMKGYLNKFETGCQELIVMFHGDDKAQSLEMLTQILEGLHYYQKLVKSAAVLLSIDLSESLYKETSILSLFDQLCQLFNCIFEAAENGDYSLLADIIEYDLIPAIGTSQELLTVVQRRYEERVI